MNLADLDAALADPDVDLADTYRGTMTMRLTAMTAITIVVMAACGGAQPAAKPTPTETVEPTPTLEGTVSIRSREPFKYDEIATIFGTAQNNLTPQQADEQGYDCTGAGGYSDIQSGAQVVVESGQGDTVGLGRLQTGSLLLFDKSTGEPETFSGFRAEEFDQRGDYRIGTICEFPFRAELASTTDFYEVSVGNRGGVTYSHTELETMNWQVDLSLG